MCLQGMSKGDRGRGEGIWVIWLVIWGLMGQGEETLTLPK